MGLQPVGQPRDRARGGRPGGGVARQGGQGPLDHVRAIFAKVGVASRGELVARLFADHVEPVHFQDVVRAHRT